MSWFGRYYTLGWSKNVDFFQSWQLLAIQNAQGSLINLASRLCIAYTQRKYQTHTQRSTSEINKTIVRCDLSNITNTVSSSQCCCRNTFHFYYVIAVRSRKFLAYEPQRHCEHTDIKTTPLSERYSQGKGDAATPPRPVRKKKEFESTREDIKFTNQHRKTIVCMLWTLLYDQPHSLQTIATRSTWY